MIFGYIDETINLESQKNIANGIAGLDNNTRLDPAVLPPLAISSVSVVQTLADRNNLIVESGDVCKVLANNTTYIYDGVNWIELSVGINIPINLDDINDVVLNNIQNNQYLKYDTATNRWINVSLTTDSIPEGATNKYTNSASLNDLNDVFINTPLPLDILKWNGVNQWINEPIFITDITDINITNVANNQLIKYDVFTNKWVNFTISTDDVPEGVNVNRKYFTNQKINDFLLNILNNQDILFNNNGNIEGLPKGVNGRYLKSGTTSISYSQINSDEILQGTNNVFYSDALVNARLGAILTTNGDLLYNNGTGPVRLPRGTNNQYLKATTTSIQWADFPSLTTTLSSLTDVSITAIANNQFLQYNSTSTKWENKSITTDNIPEGNFKYYSNTLVSTYLNTIMTTNGDLIYNNGTSSVRLSRGTNNQYLKSTATTIQWADFPTLTTTLAALTDVGILNVQNNQFLRYSTGNNKWTNQSITTDDVPSTLTNPYCTTTAIQTRLSEIMTGTGDLLIRNGASNIVRLAIGAANTFLKVNGGLPSWQTITSTDIDTALKSILTTNEDILIRRNGNITRLPVAINHGDILKYNGVSGQIEWGANVPQTTNLINLGDVQILNDPIPNKSFLAYNATNSGVANFWGDVIIETADINGLDTSLNGKLNNIFNAYGQLLIGSGGSAYQTFPKGANNDFLQVQGGFLEWNPITIAKVSNLQTSLDAKLNTNVLTTAGDILYYDGTNTTRLARGTPGQILRVNGGGTNIGWENQVVVRNYLSELLDCSIGAGTLVNNQVLQYDSTADKWTNKLLNTSYITENTNLYFTDTRCDTRLNSKYSAKGRIQVGTGLNTYAEQAAPTAVNQLPFSDINNILNTTGITWRLATLNDITSVSVNTPVNGNALIYNGANWVNSTQVTTNTGNIATISGRVDSLENNVYIQTINPAVTPSTLTFNQLNTPVIKANYIANATLVPQNALLQPVLNDATYLITASPMVVGGGNANGNFAAAANFQDLARILFTNGPVFSANTLGSINWNQTNAGIIRLNINYTNNPMAPGAYTFYSCGTGFISSTNYRFFGLKNQALVTAQMGTFNALPVVGADWDLITGPIANVAGVGNLTNVNTVNTYFMIACTADSGRIAALGVAATQTINENYQFGNQMTFSNSTGDFVITKNTALANSENWKINLSALSSYYTQTIVNKVIRAVGQINLNSSIFEDYRVRINNVFNSFSFQNSAGTATYLSVDTLGNRVTIPRRFMSTINKSNATVLNTNINLNNQYFDLSLGDATAFTITNNANASPTISMTANTNEITINNAINYKLQFHINMSIQLDKNVSVVDIGMFDASNGAVEIPQFHKTTRCDANYFFQYDIFGYFTPTVALQRISFKIRINQGQPCVPAIYNMYINITDTMM